jgi:enamine deaminase RidA (YjgF/YER057c/UK114 family)
MADHSIRKVSHSGVGYSVVDLNDVRHVFAAAAPLRGTTFDEQAGDALRTIESVICEQGTRGSIVHQAVFLADMSHLDRCRQLMREFYGADLPATSYIPQPPCDGKLLAIEALGVGQGRGEVQIERISEEMVVARHNGIAWVHCTKTCPQGDQRPIYDAACDQLQQMCRLLGSVGVSFHQVLRTWYYLGGIVAHDGPLLRYQEFNRARTDFFAPIHFGAGPARGGGSKDGSKKVYPASTGIGTTGRGIMMSAIAVATDRDDIRAVPLENPRQTAACDYSTDYSPQSPKFSRAMVLSCGTFTTIFISGTASITDSHTRHLDDAVRQTEQTLDNIAALIAEDNLARSGLPGLGTSLASLGLVRVYIKRPEDYAAVRAVCQRRLGAVPTIYAIADVCREELLVEIEGVAFSRLAAVDARKNGHGEGETRRGRDADTARHETTIQSRGSTT